MFALPSVARSEGFGIVQLAAMAAGVPVVNTRLPSTVPHVSLHGRTGLTVQPGNPSDLADALRTLLEDRDLMHRFGDAGRDRFRKEFHASMMIGRMLRHYDSI